MQVKYTQILKCVEAFLAIIPKFDIWEQNREHTRKVTLCWHLLTCCIHVQLCQNLLSSQLTIISRDFTPSSTFNYSKLDTSLILQKLLLFLHSYINYILLIHHKHDTMFCELHCYSYPILSTNSVLTFSGPAVRKQNILYTKHTRQLKTVKLCGHKSIHQLLTLSAAPQNNSIVIIILCRTDFEWDTSLQVTEQCQCLP